VLDVAFSTNVIKLSSFVFSLSVTRTCAEFVASVTVTPAITVLRAVPFTVIASASSVPSTSTSPEISKEAAISWSTCKSSWLEPSFNSNFGPVVLYVNVASSPLPPSIVIPAPLITADVLLPLSRTML